MSDLPYTACARAYARGNGGYYSFIASCYVELLKAWKDGQTFFTGTTTDGDEATVKLAEVECVMYCTVLSQDAAVRRRRDEKQAEEGEGFQ